MTGSLGTRIRELRKQRGLSQKAIADPLFTPAYISHIESGKREPSHKVIEHVAERLGITTEQLVTGRDPDMEIHLGLAIEQARAEIYTGDLEVALQAADEARERSIEQGFPRLQAKAAEIKGLALQKLGRISESLESYREAEDLLTSEAAEMKAAVVTGKARSTFMQGDVRRAVHILETYLIELNRRPAVDPTALMQTYSALIGPYMEAGLPERAYEVAGEARRLAPAVEDPEQLACMHVNLGGVLLSEGRTDEAIRSLHKAEDLFTQLGWTSEIAKASIARGMVQIENKDLDTARKSLDSALEVLSTAPNQTDRARALNQMARLERLAGNIDRALEHLDAARPLLEKGDPNERALERRERGQCEAARGNGDLALELLQEARLQYGQTENRVQVAATLMLLGDILQRNGDTARAAATYREGLDAVVR